ncbi:hypothetical protein FRC17_003012 [Serendipita sp. 399]|nr:hypothetical protein FRC17_003012 [Serendipita sp. 399]
MPPSPSPVGDVAAREEPSRAKRIVRTIMHLWHLFVSILLILIVYGFFGLRVGVSLPYALYNLYILPFALYDLWFTTIQLLGINTQRRLLPDPRSFGVFANLMLRGYLYQVAITIPFSQGIKLDVFEILITWPVWLSGLWMLTLGWIAHEFGFSDWVQEPQRGEQQRIQLSLVNNEREGGVVIDSTATTMTTSVDKRRRAKRIVRNIVHIWDLITSVLFLPIITFSLMMNRPTGSLVNPYLIPMVVYTIAYSLLQLFKRDKASRAFLRHRQFALFSRIWFRGFVYQAYAVIPLSHDWDLVSSDEKLARAAWCSGVAMVILACVAAPFGLLGWLQEQIGEEEEEEVQVTGPGGTRDGIIGAGSNVQTDTAPATRA